MSKAFIIFYDFHLFRVDVNKRLLLREGKVVSLTPKVFDVLFALIENRDKILSKDSLMQAVWPNSHVEESNLTQSISILRKALADNVNEHRYILTVPGVGYRFVAKVTEVSAEEISSQGQLENSLIEVRDASSSDKDNDEAANKINPNFISPNLNKQELPTYRSEFATFQNFRLRRLQLFNRKLRIRTIILLAIILIIFVIIIFKLEQKPIIDSISPTNPLSVMGDQGIIINGSGFQTGMSIEVYFPTGGSAILKGAQILNLTSTSFVVVIDFNGNSGKYKIRVRNPYGRSSDPFLFELTPNIQPPIIEAIFPSSPTASGEEQTVVIYGCNFQFGAAIEITFPNGESTIVNPGDCVKCCGNKFRPSLTPSWFFLHY